MKKLLVQPLKCCSFSDVIPPTVLPTLVCTFSRGNLRLSKCIRGQPKLGCNTYSASHVATTALLLSKNVLRSILRASDFLGSMPPDPASLACLCPNQTSIVTSPPPPPPLSKSPGYWPDMVNIFTALTVHCVYECVNQITH